MDRPYGGRGTRTLLVVYYPEEYYPEDDEEAPPLKARHFRVLKELFGRNIFEKGKRK